MDTCQTQHFGQLEQESHSSERQSSKKKVAATLIAASIFAGQFIGHGSRQNGYTANYEPIRMKGLSAEEMGTANSRKKSRKQRKRKNRRNK